MRSLVLLTVLAAIASSGPSAAGGDVKLRLIDGAIVEADALSLTGDGGLSVRTGSESRTIRLGEVLFATVTAAGTRGDVEANAEVLLADGSRLSGALLDGGVDLLRMRTATLGVIEVPIDRVRVVTFGAADDRLDPASLGGRGDDEDLVFRRGPVEGDVVAGTVTRIDAAGIEIDAELGLLSLSLDEVLGISVAVLEDDVEAPARPVDIELADGGLLLGDLEELSSGRLRVAVGWDEVLTIDLSSVAALRFGSARFVWLSDLTPSTVEETPFLGGSDDFLFPWRRDRTVTGGPLTVGGVRFGKGLGLHSRTRLTWNLGGEYVRLDAQVGVADEVLEHGVTGSVIVRVFVDDVVRFESATIAAGKPAVPFSVDLAGAETVRIEVDFGDRGDVGDRAVIGDPVMVLSRD